MSSPDHIVGTDTSLRNAGRMMLDNGINLVVVVDDAQLNGILTATDFIRVIAEGDSDPNATVGISISADVTTTTANESIRGVADPMIDTASITFPSSTRNRSLVSSRQRT